MLFLAFSGKSGQSISPHIVELILVPSGSLTRRILPVEFKFLSGANVVRKFLVAHESKIVWLLSLFVAAALIVGVAEKSLY